MNEDPRIALIRALYSAINRNDIPAAIELLDPSIERIEPEGFPTSGTYRGHAEMRAHLSKGRGTWAEGACEPVRFHIEGDKVVAFLHILVRLKNNSKWIDARIADGFSFRNGKIAQMNSFEKDEQALAWASLSV